MNPNSHLQNNSISRRAVFCEATRLQLTKWRHFAQPIRAASSREKSHIHICKLPALSECLSYTALYPQAIGA